MILNIRYACTGRRGTHNPFTFLTKKLTPFSINLKPTVHYITSKTAVAKLM